MNRPLAEERELLDSSNLDCSLLLFKKPGPTGFFKLLITKWQTNIITGRTYTNTGTLISRKKKAGTIRRPLVVYGKKF